MPGQSIDLEEKSRWRQKCKLFFQRPATTLESKRKEVKKLNITQPRVATADWLKILDRTIRNATGEGLEVFRGVGALKACMTSDAPGQAAMSRYLVALAVLLA